MIQYPCRFASDLVPPPSHPHAAFLLSHATSSSPRSSLIPTETYVTILNSHTSPPSSQRRLICWNCSMPTATAICHMGSSSQWHTMFSCRPHARKRFSRRNWRHLRIKWCHQRQPSTAAINGGHQRRKALGHPTVVRRLETILLSLRVVCSMCRAA